MIIKTLIQAGEYHDSVSLMVVGRDLTAMEGVQDAAVMMGTDANKAILQNAGLLTEEARAASPNDLIIAVKADQAETVELALHKAESLLRKKTASGEVGEFKPKTIRGALTSQPATNVAVISVAGRYAADEAWDALHHGLHVLLFSDNVSLEDEIALKTYARDHGLLLMGPGAGSAILNHVALGFANVVPPGPVGIISAAGTGLQEVSTLLARMGVGITQAIGTGGRDLRKEVGGIMMLEGIKALQEDIETKLIVLISKPPAEEIVQLILRQISTCQKPVIMCFLGAGSDLPILVPTIQHARTLQECALRASQTCLGRKTEPDQYLVQQEERLREQASLLRRQLSPQQRFLRGLFSGGTLCYEAQAIWKEMLTNPVFSNAPLPGAPILEDATLSQQNSAVDLGEEEFTVGRPHPMIDNDLRIRRLMQEAQDPQVAVIQLDIVLGYGAHPNPASELGEAAEKAQKLARDDHRELIVIASVTGTEEDPQCYSRSVDTLKRRGVIVCESNAAAACLAALIIR